jgi:hypothetical protein
MDFAEDGCVVRFVVGAQLAERQRHELHVACSLEQQEPGEQRKRRAEMLGSVFECSGVWGDIDSVFTESIERNDLESALMRGCKDHVGRRAVRVRSQPVGCGHAPAIAGHEPGESIRRHGRDQVIADPVLVLEKFGGDYRADRVATSVLGPRAAAPVTEEAGDGVGATRPERSAQHVEFSHGP